MMCVVSECNKKNIRAVKCCGLAALLFVNNAVVLTVYDCIVVCLSALYQRISVTNFHKIIDLFLQLWYYLIVGESIW